MSAEYIAGMPSSDFAEAKIADAKAAAAAIAAIANQYCAPYESNSAGFPKFNAQVPIPPPAKADPPVLPAAALGSEQTYWLVGVCTVYSFDTNFWHQFWHQFCSSLSWSRLAGCYLVLTLDLRPANDWKTWQKTLAMIRDEEDEEI